MEIFNRIIDEYPVRNSKSEKENFIIFLSRYLKSFGKETEILRDKESVDLIYGDITKSKVIITAHFDTAKRSRLPFLSYADGGLLGAFKTFGTSILSGLTCSIKKPNEFNYNDNSSGVATLMDIILKLESEKVVCVFLDNEEKGFYGADLFKKRYKKELEKKIILNLDCVGVGKNIGVIYYKKKNKMMAESISKIFNDENFQGFIANPLEPFLTDASVFKNSFNISAFSKDKRGDRYFTNIHTKNDNFIELENLSFISKKILENFCEVENDY